MLRDAPTSSSSFRDSLSSSPVRPAAEPSFRSFEPLSSRLRRGSCPVSARSALSPLATEKGGARRAALCIYSRGSCHFFSREGAIADRDHRFPLLVPLELAHRLRARDLSFYCRPHGLSDPWKIAATPPRVFSGERREREKEGTPSVERGREAAERRIGPDIIIIKEEIGRLAKYVGSDTCIARDIHRRIIVITRFNA